MYARVKPQFAYICTIIFMIIICVRTERKKLYNVSA